MNVVLTVFRQKKAKKKEADQEIQKDRDTSETDRERDLETVCDEKLLLFSRLFAFSPLFLSPLKAQFVDTYVA